MQVPGLALAQNLHVRPLLGVAGWGAGGGLESFPPVGLEEIEGGTEGLRVNGLKCRKPELCPALPLPVRVLPAPPLRVPG